VFHLPLTSLEYVPTDGGSVGVAVEKNLGSASFG
jgi:hypothetical protein